MRFLGKILVAEYMRLSREDGDKVESDSISNQRELITDYLSRHRELKFVSEYVDDGHSGVSFERPAFQRMMEDVKAGKVNCIIVKDLSRFGRNYIETGRYMEKIFPCMGVRFISVLDNYDSAGEDTDAERIIIPFKNLINDSYCRDISMKIRSQLDVKRKNGKFIGSFASYGYLKDPRDKNHLIPDPYAGEIVRQIFELKLSGYNSQRIAEYLNDMGVLPPAEYKRSLGMNYDCGFKVGSNPRWAVMSVNRILSNEIYTGMMVQGINSKINYKIKESRPVPKENWIRVSDTHDPLVSRDTFDKVQNLLLFDTRTAPNESAVYLLSGLVVCGDCGQNMVRRKRVRGEKSYSYFHCSTAKSGDGCSSHLINTDKLERVVLETIQTEIRLLVMAENVLNQIDRISEQQSSVKAVTIQIEALDVDIERYQNLKVQLYTDMLEELISKDEYRSLNARFTEKTETAKRQREELLERKHTLLSNKTHLKPWLEDFKKHENITKLERQIVVELIEKIIVYDKTRVEIRFRHGDEIQEMITLAGVGNKEVSVCVS